MQRRQHTFCSVVKSPSHSQALAMPHYRINRSRSKFGFHSRTFKVQQLSPGLKGLRSALSSHALTFPSPPTWEPSASTAAERKRQGPVPCCNSLPWLECTSCPCHGYLYLLSQERRLEVRLDHHLHLQLGAAHLPHQWDHPERQDNVLSGSVPGGQKQTSLRRWRGESRPLYGP